MDETNPGSESGEFDGLDGDTLPRSDLPPARDLVGTVLGGRYRILRLLGEGAMGAVYVGEHLRIGRRDAIKVLRGQHALDAESIARFNRGARNLSAIRHPNVCTLYDYGETEDGSPFLALEFITGESLKELLDREQPLDPLRAVRIAMQVADALDAAHAADIVHRDLKPANIMIERARDGTDVAKVVDFDIAKGPEATGEEVTRLGFVVGTPEYMSPEQLMGERLDGRSDIYSLGIVLFRMLTGALPFRGGNTQQIMVERLTHLPLSLAEVMPGLEFTSSLQAVLERALARDRDHRHPDSATLARELRAVAAELASGAHAAGRPLAGAAVSASGVHAAGIDHVPQTRVSPPPRPAERGHPPPDKLRLRRILIAAVVVLMLGTATVLGVKIFGADDTSGTNGNPSNGGRVGGEGPVNTSGTGGGPQTTTFVQPDDSSARGSGDDPGRGRRGNRGTTSQESTRVPPIDSGARQRTPDTPVDAAVADASLQALRREVTDLPGPQADRLRLIRDSARVMYALDHLSDQTRALAAYVVAYAAVSLGDSTMCNEWIRYALALQPESQSYQVMRDGGCSTEARP